MSKYHLGRIHEPDTRDHMFLMRRCLPKTLDEPLPRRKSWAISGRSLDQGETGTCVGHGWKNFLRCAPLRTMSGPSPYDIYRQAILLDGDPSNDNEEHLPDSGLQSGTTVRAGAQAVSAEGRLQTYLWAFNAADCMHWLCTKGPVVMGTNWYDSMFDPDHNGKVSIPHGAKIEGGHCYLLRGIDLDKNLITCENSWGDSWGKNGAFYMDTTTLQRLIQEDGECCTAIEQKLQKPTA